MSASESDSMSTPRYSIILPAYNESARIAPTLEKILAFVAARHWNAEIIVVDDGSTDATPQIVRSFEAKHAGLRLLENPGNRGKGYSVRAGMLHARGEIVLFSDADLSSPIAEADKLFAAIAGGADVAIGSRWLNTDLQLRKQPLQRRILGRIFNVALRIILGLQIKDTQCGFKAFTRRAASTIFPLQRVERWGFDPELLYLASRFNFQVEEVPVTWSHREGTRIHPWRDGMRMFADLLKIRWVSAKGDYAASQVIGASVSVDV